MAAEDKVSITGEKLPEGTVVRVTVEGVIDAGGHLQYHAFPRSHDLWFALDPRVVEYFGAEIVTPAGARS